MLCTASAIRHAEASAAGSSSAQCQPNAIYSASGSATGAGSASLQAGAIRHATGTSSGQSATVAYGAPRFLGKPPFTISIAQQVREVVLDVGPARDVDITTTARTVEVVRIEHTVDASQAVRTVTDEQDVPMTTIEITKGTTESFSAVIKSDGQPLRLNTLASIVFC